MLKKRGTAQSIVGRTVDIVKQRKSTNSIVVLANCIASECLGARGGVLLGTGVGKERVGPRCGVERPRVRNERLIANSGVLGNRNNHSYSGRSLRSLVPLWSLWSLRTLWSSWALGSCWALRTGGTRRPLWALRPGRPFWPGRPRRSFWPGRSRRKAADIGATQLASGRIYQHCLIWCRGI